MDKIRKNRSYIVLFICFLVLLWRSFKGFCWTDESFYVSTADRFFKGDIPLVDEWFRTQMSSVLMLPFYALYVLIAGSNEGVILFFRILYLLLATGVALLNHHVIGKDYPEGVATVSSLFIMCYAHLNVATFSYYMLSVILLIAALLLIYDQRCTTRPGILVVAGVFIALSVMCMPVFAVGYVLFLALAALAVLIAKSSRISERIKSVIGRMKLWDVIRYTMAGIMIPAALVIIFILGRAGISGLIKTLPYALVDNEHRNTFGYFIRKPHRCLTEVYGLSVYCSYTLIAVSFLFQKILKKHPFCETVAALSFAVFVIQAVLSRGHTGYIQVAFFLFVIPVFFVSEKKNNGLFWLMFVPAALVALIYCFSSSDFLYVMAIGCFVSSGAGVCVLYDFAKGNTETAGQGYDKLMKALASAVTIAAVFAVAVTLFLRIRNVYRDAPLDELTCKITSGVARGLYTTEEHLRQYTQVYDVIEEYCTGTGNVMFSKILPWGYAATDMRCGFPTTWRSTAYDAGQLDVYYSMHPLRQPDVIVVLDEEYGSYDAAGDVEDDHNPNLDGMSDYWKEYIGSRNMKETEVTCGRVYITY